LLTWFRFPLGLLALAFARRPPRTKKTDVAEHPRVMRHIGLLFNKPPGVCQVAIYLVVRNCAGMALLSLTQTPSLYGIRVGKQGHGVVIADFEDYW
jgi:hypothetical protein